MVVKIIEVPPALLTREERKSCRPDARFGTAYYKMPSITAGSGNAYATASSWTG
jgi:hypothetical protein